MESIGVHRLTNHNLMDGIDELMVGLQADIALIDPPWGEGNEKYWHTALAKVDPKTNIIRPPHNEFLDQFFYLLKQWTKPDAFIFVEYGVRWREEIVRRGEISGLHSLSIVEAKYKASSKLLPYDMHIFGHSKKVLSPKMLNELSGRQGFEVARAAMREISSSGQVMLDLCSGLGGFAKVAHEFGLRYFGNEMNPSRYARTEKVLRRYENLQ